jgi:hypothetical protein
LAGCIGVTAAWTAKYYREVPTSASWGRCLAQSQSYTSSGELTRDDFEVENPNIWAVLYSSFITRCASNIAYKKYGRAMTGLNVMEAVADSFKENC